MGDNATSGIGLPMVGNVIDRDSIISNINGLLDSIPDLSRHTNIMVAEGDAVAAFTIWNGTANGNPFIGATTDFFWLSDSQIQKHWQVGEYLNFTGGTLSPT